MLYRNSIFSFLRFTPIFFAIVLIVSSIIVISAVQTASARYVFDHMWGKLGSGDGEFDGPQGISVDNLGNVYVADSSNDRIQKFSKSGTFIRAWGAHGSGEGQFNAPVDIAADNSGNVYVTDFANHRIQKFGSAGNFIREWGTDGSGNGQFQNIAGVAVDRSGNVYVSDAPSGNDRIQKFTTTGNFITRWGSEGSGDGQFNGPVSVAVDNADNVYVTDQSNSRIQKFKLTTPCPTGTTQVNLGVCFITKWGTFGSGNGQFNASYGVAVDSSGNVYVADQQNHRIQKFRQDGTFATNWGTLGSAEGQFKFPLDVTVFASGVVFFDEKVFVSDTSNDRIQVFFWEPDIHPGNAGLQNSTQANATVTNGIYTK